MKKLIQICSVLALAIAFAIIPANAQSGQKVSADVPFDFNAAGKHYSAGKYNLKVAEVRSNIAVLYLTDGEGKVLDTILASSTGDAPVGEAQLAFNNYDGQRFLSSISASGLSYRLPRTGAEKQVASGRRNASERPVSIAMKTEL